MDNIKFLEQVKNNKYFDKKFPSNVFKEFSKFKVCNKSETKSFIIRLSRFLFALIEKVFKSININYDMRTTTQRYTIYIGSDWEFRSDLSKYALIMHELQHMRQWKKWNIIYPVTYVLNIWSLLFPVVGIVFSFNWIICIALLVLGTALPAGLSLRGYWELEAFKVSLEAYDKEFDNFFLRVLCERYVKLLTKDAYYYAACFVKKYIVKTLCIYRHSLRSEK